jgi:hypothetical protein
VRACHPGDEVKTHAKGATDTVAVPPTRLDDAGRCCGRKPLVYKRPRPGFHFCCRCDRAFALDTGEQIDNWQWKKTPDGNFVATYTQDRDITGRKIDR